jgi:putative oxidoreductase
MSNQTTQPLFPSLAKSYSWLNEWAYLLLRVTAGLMLIPHIWLKVGFGPAAVAANVMAKRGLEPAIGFAYGSIIVESIAAVGITLGLFTRPAALLAVIEFIVITRSHLNAGWMVSGPQNGAEYVFLWLVVFVFIMMRGGGPYSVDAFLRREV